MEYNTSREPLVISEYGRNIQAMIEQLLTIEEKDKRTRAAHYIVGVMAQMNPQAKDSSDYMHKLWDHLHIISKYKLDVDSPFPAPTPEVAHKKPFKIVYNQHDIRYGHYGHNIAAMVNKAILYDEGAEKDALVEAIANQMKKLYLSWNHDTVSDETLSQNLMELSGGRLSIKEGMKIMSVNEIVSKNIGNIPSPQSSKKRKGPIHRKRR